MSTSKRIMPLRQRLIKAKHPEAIRLHSYIVLRPRYDDLGAVQAVAYIPMRRSLDSELYAKLLEEAAEVQYWHRMTPLELLIQRNNLVETLTEARDVLRITDREDDDAMEVLENVITRITEIAKTT